MNIVGGSIGRTAIFDIYALANINQAVCLIRVFDEIIEKEYLLKFFNSETSRGYMFDKQVDNARANLSMGNISKFVIPLPPNSESLRIITKADALMALCDTLKIHINESKTTQLHLADAMAESALNR
jgi:type I restriction enzyme S subunit